MPNQSRPPTEFLRVSYVVTIYPAPIKTLASGDLLRSGKLVFQVSFFRGNVGYIPHPSRVANEGLQAYSTGWGVDPSYVICFFADVKSTKG